MNAVTRVWSKFQQAIFEFIVIGVGSAIIEAVAGSGKTTTIVEAFNYAKVYGTAIFLAFNKPIADELAKRGLNARTFHSVCNGAVSKFLKQYRVFKVEKDKLWNLINNPQNFTESQQRAYGTFIRNIVSKAKQVGIGTRLVEDTFENWEKLADHYNLYPQGTDSTLEEGIALAQKLLSLNNDVARCRSYDFDDQLYFVILFDLALDQYDFIFVDEAQDTNDIQLAILWKLMKRNEQGVYTSRMIAVGDPAQAIYGFRGANADSMDKIAREFNCIKLPLSVTYRCATEIVKFVQQWVTHIQAAEGAQAGKVLALGDKWDTSIFSAQDLVVCRTTAPVVALGYKMLKARKPVYIMGRDIGEGLKSLVKRMKAKGIDQLMLKLEEFTRREVEIATKANNATKAANVQDKSDAIIALIMGMDENHRTIPELERIIDELFADKANATVLSTIHRAKGLESRKVFWLNRSKCPSKWAKKDWELKQEDHLCYVAGTRAKEELVLLEELKTNGDHELDKAA